jgi:hypothetical protein
MGLTDISHVIAQLNVAFFFHDLGGIESISRFIVPDWNLLMVLCLLGYPFGEI